MHDLLDRLRERKIFQWAFAYLAGAWVTLQVTVILAEQFAWAGWVQRSITILLAVGLLIALVLAWYHGEKGRQRVSGAELVMVAALLVVAGAAILLVRGSDVVGGAGAVRSEPGTAAADDPVSESSLRAGSAGSTGELDRQKVAVLPFRTLGEDQEGAAFAHGVHDDILTRLSKIGALRVISRTSVMEYEGSPKNVREIAAELGAGAILEGGVQRAGGQVRINVQLIDARADEHVWAESYDRPWNLENLFAIQTEIAERVAAALEANLSSEEMARVGDRPTDDAEAYELYQRARRLLLDEEQEARARLAVEVVEEATERDPSFAAAFATLGYTHALLYWFHFDRSPARLRAAKAAVDSALALDPDLAEAHVALGYYWYWGHLDYERAMDAFGVAERSGLSDSDLMLGIASVQRRRGRMVEALEYFRRAREVAPRERIPHRTLGETLQLLRRFDEAEAAFRRALDLRPESPTGYVFLARHYLIRGAPARAHRVLEEARELGVSDPVLTVLLAADVHTLERDHTAALEALERAANGTYWDDQFRYVPVELAAAQQHEHLGEMGRARELYEAARSGLEREMEARPDDPRLPGALGLALAGLGRAEEAVRLGQRAVEMLPLEREAWRGAYRLEELGRIHASLGRAGPAVEILERLLSVPADVTAARLRVDPAWDPIRDDPRFQALVRGET